MALGNTTSSNLIVPELWLEAVAGALPGMSVLGATGAMRVETGLPGGARPGSPVNVPYFGTLGEMRDYADGDAIDVQQLSMTEEQASVVRSGIAFNITDMARRLAGYADPYGEAARQFTALVARRADKAGMDALNASGLPTQMVLDVHSSSSPVYLDRDLVTEARLRWGDEQDGVAAIVGHSVTLKNLLKLKDGNGQPLLRVMKQNNDTGVVEFDGLPPFFTSDRSPVAFAITSAGSSPPTITVSGYAYGDINLRIEITTTGVRGVADFRWSINGGTTWEATAVLTAAEVELGTSGLTVAFASGTYTNDNVYTCSTPEYTTALVKAGACVFWTDPPNAEDFRDPLRKATISATEILHVSHRYNRMPGRTRPGVVRILHNNRVAT